MIINNNLNKRIIINEFTKKSLYLLNIYCKFVI